MGADEGRIGDGLGLVHDIGHLPLGRAWRHRLFLGVGKAGHFQLDFGLGDKGADLRQAESRAKTIKRNHLRAPISLNFMQASGGLLPP